jgi:ABC-type nitrate/sulfonate/bicarbonate transport system ATPase subunit/ABC-type glycerol-3-phosphate transport system permease component
MTKGDWLGLKRELPGKLRLSLTVLSFLLPLLLWSAVSYVPWLWHPLVKISDPGEVEYFSEGLDVPRADFEQEVEKARKSGAMLPVGERVNPVYLPAPHEVARAFYTAFITPPRLPGEPWLHESLGHSIRTIVWGFFLSSLVGVPLGILCGSFRFFSRLQEPFIEFFRYLPAPAFGALCVAVLGIDDGPKIAIIFIGTFFQQVLVISNTVRKVDPALVEAAQTLGASRAKLVRRVIIPASISDIYTDMRILLGVDLSHRRGSRRHDVGHHVFHQPAGALPQFRQRICCHRDDRHHRICHGPVSRVAGPDALSVETTCAQKKRDALKAAQDFYESDTGNRRAMMLQNPAIPDYRAQAPEVQARFEKIRQRLVILSVRDLQKSYATDEGTHVVFDKISLDIHRREFITVIGPSGCGKSTFLRIIAGLDDASSGEVLLDGKPVSGPGPDRGMVFQGYTLFPWLTVRRNVMFGLEMAGKGRSTAEAEAREWLAMVGLEKFENAYPHELSGGMKQRVAIARALAAEPRILIMDEPFGALDAITRCKMQSHLLQIWKKVDVTILFITHDLDEAVYLSDRILVMGTNPGRVVEFIENPVPRPRSVQQILSPEFLAVKHRLDQLIHPVVAIGDEEKLPMVKMTAANDEIE